MEETGGWAALSDIIYELPLFTVRRGGLRWPAHQEAKREEETVADLAVQLLAEQKADEERQWALEIVNRVRALNVAQYLDGTEVRFTKKFSGDREYTYLAVKTAGQWFVTGDDCHYDDDAFERLLAGKVGFVRFEVTYVKGEIVAMPYKHSSHAVGEAMEGEEDPT